jgi:hypothetical protein
LPVSNFVEGGVSRTTVSPNRQWPGPGVLGPAELDVLCGQGLLDHDLAELKRCAKPEGEYWRNCK